MKEHRHHPKAGRELCYITSKSELQCRECGATIIPSEGGVNAMYGVYCIWVICCVVFLLYLQEPRMREMLEKGRTVFSLY